MTDSSTSHQGLFRTMHDAADAVVSGGNRFLDGPISVVGLCPDVDYGLMGDAGVESPRFDGSPSYPPLIAGAVDFGESWRS